MGASMRVCKEDSGLQAKKYMEEVLQQRQRLQERAKRKREIESRARRWALSMAKLCALFHLP